MKDLIKLLIVDDSKLMRQVLRRIFESEERIKVVGEASDGKEALELIPSLSPDVITLDINMPVMDGLTTLKHIMIKSPTPTVMCSTLTEEGASVTFDALKYGAVDFIYKPSNQQPASLEEQSGMILKKVILAANTEIKAARVLRTGSKSVREKSVDTEKTVKYMCAIGASEGGYAPLLKMIPNLSPDLPAAFLVILHEAPNHVEAFASYLEEHSAIKVVRAKDGAAIYTGSCYLASGKDYVNLYSFYGEYSLSVNTAPFSKHKGTINTLMLSLAELMKAQSTGILLSGSGEDGVEGLGEIINVKGSAMIQSPESCLYKEIPLEAIKRYSNAFVIPDNEIATELNKRFAD